MTTTLLNQRVVPPEIYADLIGVPFKPGGRDLMGLDCVGVVLECYRRQGISLPDPQVGQAPTSLWDKIELDELRPWDIVKMNRHGFFHVGLYLGRDRVLHVFSEGLESVCVVRLSGLLRLGFVSSCYRPSPSSPETRSLELEPGKAAVTLVDGYFATPSGRQTVAVDPGTSLRGLIPPSWDPDTVRVFSPRGAVDPRENVPLAALAGESYSIVRFEQGVPPIFPGMEIFSSVIGSIGTQLVSGVVHAGQQLGAFLGPRWISTFLAPTISIPKQRAEVPSPGFSLDGLQNTAAPYLPIPVVYGNHRVAGNIVSAFYRPDANERSVLYMLIALCQGPIQDIAGLEGEQDGLEGSSIPDGIRFDGNAASNFTGIKVSTRTGENEQTPIPGFDQATDSVSIAATMYQGTPVDHETTSAVDAFEVVIDFPAGLYHIGSQGGVNNNTVDFTLTWQKIGGNPSSRTFSITRAKRAAFSIVERVDVSADPGIYEITLTRNNPIFPDGNNDQTESVWSAVNEITSGGYSWSGVAMVGLEITSIEQLAGRIPNVTFDVKGKKVWVWDGVSTANPNFNFEWTDNPAWCVLDGLLNTVYGLARGGDFTLNNIDLQGFKDWADLCDEFPNLEGSPSSEPRARLDGVFGDDEDAWDVFQGIAKSAWCELMMVGNKVTPVLLDEAPDSALLTEANLISLEMNKAARSTRPNYVEVQFQNEDTDFSIDEAVMPDDNALLTLGQRQIKETVRTVGVTRSEQAHRYAKFRLNFAQNARRTFTFEAGLDTIHLLPGDVVLLTSSMMRWGISGRVHTSTSSTIYLDQEVTISDGDKIQIRTDDTGADVLQERTLQPGGTNITVPARTPINITPNWDGGDLPDESDVYAIGTAGTYTQRVRIQSIETRPDMTRAFRAHEYDATLFDDDPGPIPTSTPDLPKPTDLPDDLTNVSLVEEPLVQADGSTTPVVVAYAKVQRGGQRFQVWYRTPTETGTDPGSDSWIYAGESKDDRLALTTLPPDELVEVSLVPVSPAGIHKGPERGTIKTIKVRGRSHSHPALPADVQIAQLDEGVALHLPQSTERDVTEYEVRVGGSWAVGYRVSVLPPGDHIIPLSVIGTGTVRVRSRNKSGAVSLTEATSQLTTQNPAGSSDYISNNEDDASWSGTLTDIVPVLTSPVTEVELDTGTSLTGSYTTPDYTTGLPSRRSVARVSVEPALDETAMRWDEAGFRWDSDLAGDLTWDTAYLSGFENVHTADLTWDEADFPWDGLIAESLTWDGPRNIADEMRTVVEFETTDDNGSSWSGLAPFLPQEVQANGIRAKASLTALHSRYTPKLTNLESRLTFKREAEGYKLKTGFPYDPDTGYQITLSYNPATRQVTITPTGSTFDVWLDGVRFTYTGAQVSTAHANTTGGYFVYYDEDGVLVTTTTPWDLLKHAPVASITYGATDAVSPFVLFELHSATRDPQLHRRLHFGGGTQVSSRLGLPTMADDGPTFTATAIEVLDEDIELETAALDTTFNRVVYRSGTDGEFRLQENTFAAGTYAGQGIGFLTNGTEICWNELTATSPVTWQKTAVSNNYFVNMYLVACTEITQANRYFILPGQAEYATQEEAENEDPNSLAWGDAPPEEFVIVAQITFQRQTSNGANNHYADIKAIKTLEGNRSFSSSGGVTDHGALSGLADVADHPGYVTLDGTRPLTSDWDLNGNEVTTSSAPSGSTSYTNKLYVDTIDAFLWEHGNLLGITTDDDHTLYVHTDPSSTSRNYIQPTLASVVPLKILAHATQTANLFAINSSVIADVFTVDANGTCKAYGFNATSQKITKVADGTAATDAINLGQLDARIDSGTSFPGSPTDGQKFYRTDLQRWFVYFGTRGHWLSEEVTWFRVSFNSTGLTNSNWLRRENGTATNSAPLVALLDGVICEYSGSAWGTVVDLDLDVNTVPTPGSTSPTSILTITRTSSGGFGAVDIDVDISQGDLLALNYDATKSGSNSVNNPTLDIGIRWKAT